MFVLQLCQQFCPEKIPVKTGSRIGSGGADGEVFEIIGESDKVIKMGILYDRHDRELLSCFSDIQKGLDYVMTVQPDVYVRVYEHGYLGTYSRKMEYWKSGKQKFIIYYYIMERLQKITEDERRVFHSILSHEDRGIIKNFSFEKIREMLMGMSRGLDFDAEKVILFCNKIKNTNLKHLDLHPRNIMRDLNGYYKCIDLDRCELLTELEKDNV